VAFLILREVSEGYSLGKNRIQVQQACASANYLHIENAEGYVLIAVYLFIYLYACSSHNKKSIKPNRMKFGGMIGYYPGTI